MSTTTTLPLLRTPPADRLERPGLAELCEAVDAAGLTGRGGAGFPTGVKLRAVAEASSRSGSGCVVVGNAMEGEPLSSKDAVLLQRAPHLVVEGLAIVGAALGATRRVLGVGSHLATTTLTPVAGRHGVEVVTIAGGFVTGQESALVRGLNHQPPVPADPTIRVSTRGVDGQPTLVLNAETLANVALVARFGPGAAGTHLVTLSGALTAPGVIEIARGSVLRDVVDLGRPTSVQAVLVGGYHGAWLPASALDTRLTREELEPWNAAVGAGVVHVLGVGSCPLRATAEIASYLADQSAGQCGPCVNALPRVADTFRRLANGPPDSRLPAEIARLSRLAHGRGACAHPDGTVRMLSSAMRVFDADVEAHLEGRCLK